MAHILAVDDDPDLCTLLKTALERDGHAVEIRTSGVTVTESLCRWADCILLDVMMPGEDGLCHLPPHPRHNAGTDFIFDCPHR